MGRRSRSKNPEGGLFTMAPPAIRNLNDVLTHLPRVLDQIRNVLSHSAALRGTAEAALAESQGAQMVVEDGSIAQHFPNLSNAARSLQGSQEVIRSSLQLLHREEGFQAASDVKNIVKPLVEIAKDRTQVMSSVRQLGLTLQQTVPSRLAGMRFGQGGLGTELGRSYNSLVSVQIQQQAGELVKRGVDPRLIPQNLGPTANAVMDDIEEMPISLQDAAKQVGPAAAASGAAARAAVARSGTAASSSFLNLLAALANRLTSFLILPLDPNQDFSMLPDRPRQWN
jgi:hypothetical protein